MAAPILVPISPRHAGAIQRLVTSDRSITEQTRLPDAYPADGAARWIEVARHRHAQGIESSFAVEHDREVVGACGLIMSADRREAELGYWVGRPYWGLGYATEAARAAVAFAFESANVDRVVALPLAGNAPSRRVLEKVGLRLMGLRPAEAPWEGQEQAVYEAVQDRTAPQG